MVESETQTGMVISNLYKTVILSNSSFPYNVNKATTTAGTLKFAIQNFNNTNVPSQNISLKVDNAKITSLKGSVNQTNLNLTESNNVKCDTNGTLEVGLSLTDSQLGLVTVKANELIYQFMLINKVGPTTEGVSYQSGYGKYNDGYDVKYAVDGKLVTITGVIKNTSKFTPGGTSVHLCTIPTKYAPSQKVNKVQAGSSVNKFLYIVDTDGKLYIQRYGTSTYNVEIPAGAWLPCEIEYFID